MAIELWIGARAVREADLVALVDERSSGQREQELRGGADVRLPEARGQPVEVVVRQHPGDAANLGGGRNRRAQRLGLPRREQELEGEDEIEVLEPARILGRAEKDLADQQRIACGLPQRRERL